VVIPGQGAGSKVKAHKTSGGRKTPVRHTIPLGIVIFLVYIQPNRLLKAFYCTQYNFHGDLM